MKENALKKGGNSALQYMQKLGKALMFPVACMPLCGILMGIGYLLCPATMQGGDIVGVIPTIGSFLVKAGGALIDNIPILFAIGVGIGMAKDGDGIGGLASLVSYLILTTLLGTGFVTTLDPSIANDAVKTLAFDKIANPFIGILAGIIGSVCYNRFHKTKLPQWLSFFSGKRSVALVAGAISIVVAAALFFIWPVFFGWLVAAGQGIAGLGNVGAGLYAALNRLLIPSGLHHALNNVFWFDTVGLGDLTHFWAGETSADVSWSLGMYMSGFFPSMMFGIGGAATAIVLCTRKQNRKKVLGILLSSVICAFVCGVTEPFEFSFMFLSPLLYLIYAVLFGIVAFVSVQLGFRAGFSFSGGATDLLFSAGLPAAQKTWLIIPLGIGAFLLFFGMFYGVIRLCHLKLFDTDDEPAAVAASSAAGGDKYAVMASRIFTALGGNANLQAIDNCITRLRLTVNDNTAIDEPAIRAAGSPGVIRIGKNGLQIVIGTDVQFVADELKAVANGAPLAVAPAEEPAAPAASADRKPSAALTLGAPVGGRFLAMQEIPDPVFSDGVLGPCCGVEPDSDTLVAPADGEIIQVADTLHSVCLACGDYEILLHAGIDTVKLNGKGFTCPVQVGDTVQAGQPVLVMERSVVAAEGCPTVVVTVVTNADDEANVHFVADGTVKAGEPLVRIDG